jgi:hypothetical protein
MQIGRQLRTSAIQLRIDNIGLSRYYAWMGWEVEFTEEFARWWDTLTPVEQDDVESSVLLLIDLGPQLGRPHVDTLKGSRHTNMKELRTQSHGNPHRTFFAFDPRRTAILLIGGDKTGDKQFYKRMTPVADKLYDQHLDQLQKEGLI